MQIFGRPPAPGRGTIDLGKGRVDYAIEKIPSGFLVTGRVRGRAGTIEIFRTAAPREFLMNNWQSWGPTRKVSKETRFPEYEDIVRNGRGLLFSPVPGEMQRTLVSDYFVVWDGGMAGFLASRDGHPYFAVEDGEFAGRIEYSDTDLGDGVEMEPLIVLEGAPAAGLLEEYAGLAARANAVSLNPWNPVGWCSWYQYFGRLSWPDIVGNAEKARNDPDFPFEVFQIDDGFEEDIGDWDRLRPGYPRLEEMASAIRDRGFVPGIWTAPFSAAASSALFKRHPEWMVRREGASAPAYRAWDRDIHALDTTHPDAKQWLFDTFTRLKKAGFAYFKIDFLFAGAMPGERARPVTPIRAYREGLEVIRKAVGRDFVLGCGAPLLPSAGLVDGMRIGEDTAPVWKPKPSPFQGPGAYIALKNALERQFMHGRLWLNDPDCLLLRATDIDLRPGERELFAVVSGAMDNMLIDSDDLSLVDNAGRELFRRALNLRGGRATVLRAEAEDLYIIESGGGPSGPARIAANLGDQDASWKGESVPAHGFKVMISR